MFGYDAAIRVVDDDNVELAAAVWKCVLRRRAAPVTTIPRSCLLDNQRGTLRTEPCTRYGCCCLRPPSLLALVHATQGRVS